MKYCSECGAANEDRAKFCVNCGASFDANRSAGPEGFAAEGNGGDGEGYQNEGSRYNGGFQNNQAFKGNGGYQNVGNGREEVIYTNVAPRSIPVAIILSIVTCGIYFLYWMYMINNEINELAQDPMAPSGGIVILLSIVTCGIYSWYWYYKMGEKCDYITQSNSSSNVIFLILGIFGLGIVSVALMQDSVNRVLQ